ncbi:TIGR03086 family metal-binding protein [Agilicoccus flavus]|uniref:TIGR03086 family metal-binding protein n=1 Tax=Agilicoccus flavus TaxID=2775968 RepID=UPI001CF6F35C|nr:TIGR03086 family metal-binding protein [Agilicoccus flavus]
MALPESPDECHRVVAGAFTDVVAGVADWDAPAPVEGWAARDVVDHLTTWLPALLDGGSDARLPAGPPVEADPAAAWRAHAAAVQELLDDPRTASKLLSNPHIGELPLPTAIDRFYTSDVFMHTWDLARASGQEVRLDPDVCAEMLAGMSGMEDVLRGSGQYGPRVDVRDDAPVQDRLMGFIGRDPAWRPPNAS